MSPRVLAHLQALQREVNGYVAHERKDGRRGARVTDWYSPHALTVKWPWCRP